MLGGVLGGVLGGCASSPDVAPPPLPVAAPAHWIEGSGAAEGEITPQWWRSFGEAELDVFVERVLSRNHDLAAASARLEAAIVQGRIGGADLWPTLDAGLTGDRQRRVFVGFPFGTGGVPSLTYNLFGVSLATSWELDLWGRVRAGASAAHAEADAAAADFAGAALSLAGQSCKAWFAAVEAQQQVELARATLQSYSTTAARAHDRFARGIGDAVEVRLAESNLASAESNLERQRDGLQAARRQLDELAGDYPAADAPTGLSLPPPPPPAPAGLPADLVARRPDLVAVERRVAAANLRTDQARAALYPRIALTGSLGTSTDAFDKLLDGDYFVWALGANLLQPLFAGGKLRAQVELDAARARELGAQWSSLVLRAYREVEQTLASERFAAAQRAALTRAVDEAVAAETLAQERYGRGLTSFLEVLEAQRRVLGSRAELIAVDRRRLDLRIDLLLALGGGFGPIREPRDLTAPPRAATSSTP
ncbi:MAG: efflux transporter outer membrane subunit [Planctomycetota bacterium]